MAARREKCRSFDTLHRPGQWLFLAPKKLHFSSCDNVLLGMHITTSFHILSNYSLIILKLYATKFDLLTALEISENTNMFLTGTWCVPLASCVSWWHHTGTHPWATAGMLPCLGPVPGDTLCLQHTVLGVTHTFLNYTGWTKSLCAPDDYSTKTSKKYFKLFQSLTMIT
jgi:hypothetical protein